jgi:GPH family glycoside/pentoside/hexuronide:cation symporter
MSMIMYAVWLVPTPDVTDGILNRAGYAESGLVGAILIALSMAAFSFGLHRYIPRLRQYRNESSLLPRDFLTQARDVFREPSLRALGMAGIIYYAASGTYAVLWVYIYSFFWEFSSAEISLLVIPMVMGGVALLPLVSRVTFGREKKRSAIFMFVGAAGINAAPILLRLLGFFPDNGSDLLFWIMMGAGFFETLLFLLLDSLLVSMTSDLTEQNQLKTGRRNEGVILSVLSFLQKCAGALGTLIGGLIIDLIAFPENAVVGEVDPEVLFDLGLAYGPLILGLYLVACVFILGYRVSREIHSATVARLRESAELEKD